MTQAPETAGLRQLYQRPTDSPVTAGDHVDQMRVIGFALAWHPEPAERLLTEGEEGLAQPPSRPVPGPADPGICRTGPSPVEQLDSGCLHAAGAGLSDGYERQLVARGPAGEFMRALFADVAARKHVTWLVGGAVRDLLASGPQASISDLDFTGTIGPVEIGNLAVRHLRAAGGGDYQQKISPRLVWSVTPPQTKERLVEYKPLARDGFRFPAWGGDLESDAAARDLTVNAIYYDDQRKIVADPTGLGIAHLRATPRVAMTPYQGKDPTEAAFIILRCLKFRLRWPDLELGPMAQWASLLPADLTTLVDGPAWDQLAGMRARCVPEPSRGAPEFAIAAELGPVAERLIRCIQRRAGS